MLSILDLGRAVMSIRAAHYLKHMYFSILDDSDFFCSLLFFL